MLFKVLALPLMASLACASAFEKRQNNLVMETIEYCTTKLGTATVAVVSTTSTTKKSAVKTYTSTVTYTPIATKTPLYDATTQYTTTTTISSTITITSVPPVTTVLPGAAQSPIGADLVEQKRDLEALERIAAYNRDMIKARDVASSSILMSSTDTTSAASETVTAAEVVVIVNGGQSPPMLPEAVGCTLTITGSTTVTNTKTAKKTSTVTAVPSPTGTHTLKLVTVSTTTSVTTTYVAPTPTYYAACNATELWIVSEVAGMPVEAFGSVKGSTTVATSDATAYDCCASCQQVPTCLFSFFDDNSGTCEFVKGTEAADIPWYVGNYTSTYDSLSMANGPATNLAYCGLVPGCTVKDGVEHCGA